MVHLGGHLGGVGLALVALIAGRVGFTVCFIWRGGICDIVVCVVYKRIVGLEEIWCRWIGFSIGSERKIGGSLSNE